MKAKILITNHVPADHLGALPSMTEVLYGPNDGSLMKREEVLALAPQLTAIINQHELRVDEELLRAAPNLRIIANVAIGYNNFDIDALNRHGVWGTNCPGIFADSAADHTFALLLAVARRIPEADAYVRSGLWQEDGFQPGIWDGMLLHGRTIGIVGFGAIGRRVAQRAEGFGMKVRFSDMAETEDPRQCSLEALLRKADVISLHVPLTDSTHHLINRSSIEAMKPGTVILNLARGPVVDEAALADALRRGHLGGAGLDVLEDEPCIHPDLLACPNLVLSPHVGGGTRESRRQARLLCASEVLRVLEGKEPAHAVNSPFPR